MKSLLATLLICFFAATCDVGGGGSNQQAPDTIKSDEPANIKLELSAPGSVKGRYTDVACYFRFVGSENYQQLRSEPIAKDKTHEVYQFTIPPAGRTGEIEYYFELKLDGHPSRINGSKKIKVV